MPKIKSNQRTQLQERILTTICLLDCTVGQGAYFRATAINRILGGRWTQYREKAIEGLVDSGLLLKIRHRDTFYEYYALSNSARRQLSLQYDVRIRDYFIQKSTDDHSMKVGTS